MISYDQQILLRVRLDHLLHSDEHCPALKAHYAKKWAAELADARDPELIEAHKQFAACRAALTAIVDAGIRLLPHGYLYRPDLN